MPLYQGLGKSIINFYGCASKFKVFSLDVPMGAKVCLSGTVRLSHGMILLDNKNCQLLGGEVPHLIQEWRMQQVSSWKLWCQLYLL